MALSLLVEAAAAAAACCKRLFAVSGAVAVSCRNRLSSMHGASLARGRLTRLISAATVQNVLSCALCLCRAELCCAESLPALLLAAFGAGAANPGAGEMSTAVTTAVAHTGRGDEHSGLPKSQNYVEYHR